MERNALKVSELNRLVKSMLEGEPLLRDVWIEGEISNLRRQSSGHLYFSLKDEQSQIRCVMFVGKARMLRFRPEDQMKVLLCGSVSLYERDGTYQMIAGEMEPLGIGALAQALEQLKQRLAIEGLFDAERKQKLPFCPRVVGIATSPSGAALRDIAHVLRRRFPNVRIVLAPCLVQGDGAAEQIVTALDLLGRTEDVEVIIVGRGGGSLEDLWCFNEEIVVRAIATSRKPVVSAVGHETDFTLSDLAADLRAPTPSAAAEMVVPEVALLAEGIVQQIRRLRNALRQRLQSEQEDLAAIQERLDPEKLLLWSAQRRERLNTAVGHIFSTTRERTLWQKRRLALSAERLVAPQVLRSWVAERRRRLNEHSGRLFRLSVSRLNHTRTHLAGNAHKLQLVSPLRLLSQGYTMLHRVDATTLITSVRQLRTGDDVIFELSDGRAEARILDVIPNVPEGQERKGVL